GAEADRAGRVRRRGVDRQALPAPGRDRNPLGAHDRPPDARRRDDHDPRPRHARAGPDPARRRPRARARPARRALVAAKLMGWQELSLESEALRENPLGDSAARPLFVWTPPDVSRPLPAL